MERISKAEFRGAPSFSASEQDITIRSIADAVHRANEAVRRGVDAGLSIELVRASRYHDRRGSWGDQLIPVVHGSGSSGTAKN